MPEKPFCKSVKPTRAQIQFLITTLLWLAVLQSTVLWYISQAESFICNGNGAWPLSSVPFLGNGIITLSVSIFVIWWAWRTLQGEQQKIGKYAPSPFLWALLVATGISHAIERITSQCVLDYWQLPLPLTNIHFNLGDVSLTLGVILLGALWLAARKKNS